MSWDYFVHVCHGPLSFAIFDLGVDCLLNFLFASDVLRNVSRVLYFLVFF